jgi:DNA-binding Lrp family transcriptional regulator
MEAYVVVNTEPNSVWEVEEEIRKIEGIKRAHVVAGRFDIIVYTEFDKVDELGRIILDIQQIKGITQTQTLLVIPPTLRDLNPNA